MSPTSLVRTALAVLNACVAGAEPDPQDVARLRHAAGPDAADWKPDVVAGHILAEESRRATAGNSMAASR